jgi:hypothetical protein
MPMSALAVSRFIDVAGLDRRRAVAQLLSTAPLWVLLIAAFEPRGLLLDAAQSTPVLAGVPLGLVVIVGALLWMTTGALIVRLAPSPLVQALALLLFTIPATVAAFVAPALALGIVSPG